MIFAGAGLVVLPYRGLLTVAVPLVLALLLPSKQAGLMPPLIRGASQHQGVLHPDTAAGQVEARFLERRPEVDALGISMPDVDRAVVGKVRVHTAVCRQKEFVEFRVLHVVVHDLARRLLDIDVVRGISQNEVCLFAVHKPGVDLFAGTVTADDPMPAQQPEVSRLGEAGLLQLLVHIEVIFFDLFVVDVRKERIHLRRVKACVVQVIVRVLQIGQKVSQQLFVPFAGDLVERDVQRLFTGLIHIDHRAGNLGISQVDGDVEPLVAADDRHVGIHHERVGKAKFLDRVLDLFVFPVSGLQLFAGIVFRRLQHGDRQYLQFSSLFHIAPPVNLITSQKGMKSSPRRNPSSSSSVVSMYSSVSPHHSGSAPLTLASTRPSA